MVRDGIRHMHTFARPLTLDPMRTLTGFRYTVRNGGVNRFYHFYVYAIAAVPYISPRTVLILR